MTKLHNYPLQCINHQKQNIINTADIVRLKQYSPLRHASNIKKPLMVLQGANDPGVLKIESDEVVEAVKKNNVPVEYVILPDEGHGFVKKENEI